VDPWSHLATISSKHFPSHVHNASTETSASNTPFPETSGFSMRDLIHQLRSSDNYRDQIVPGGHRTFPERLAEYCMPKSVKRSQAADLSRPLSPELKKALSLTRGISRLYSHQAKAINDLWENRHVIVSTSTASGKSLIYQIPVIDALEQDQDVRALYIFPTKALAQDQRKSLSTLLSNMSFLSHILAETFDGDTPQGDRSKIRENASGKMFNDFANLLK
jgi:DEAD/DEAH box helicase domain-containing protein